MTPAMIFTPDGQPLIAYGSPGGATIINSVLNVTLNLIDHKMTLQDAIRAPRVSVTSTGSAISLEPGFPQITRDGLLCAGLRASGHGRHRFGSGRAPRPQDRPAIRRCRCAPRRHA